MLENYPACSKVSLVQILVHVIFQYYSTTEDGEFVFHSVTGQRATQYVMIMQLVPAPGIIYKSELTGKFLTERICQIKSVIGSKIAMVSREWRKKQDQMEIHFGYRPHYVSLFSKKQMERELKRFCEVDKAEPLLTIPELKQIFQLFLDNRTRFYG